MNRDAPKPEFGGPTGDPGWPDAELSLTRRVEDALRRDKRFSNVDHARPQISQDENGYEPNVLKFYYCGLPYFARVENSGILIERPGGFSGELPVGKLIRPEDSPIAAVIAKTIDDAKLE